MTTNKDYIPKTGDSCQHAGCDGWLVVVRSERLEQAGVVMRDFGCWKCKRRSVPFETRVTAKGIETGRGRSITAATQAASPCRLLHVAKLRAGVFDRPRNVALVSTALKQTLV